LGVTLAKIDPEFAHDVFMFLHKPIREADLKDGDSFLERFLIGPQNIFEDTQDRILTLRELFDPSKTRADLLQFLKDHVGFTKELNNITNDISENDLRKLISLAVALFKQKGTEPGYINIVRLFTGKSARVFNYFDFRMIVGEAAFGEEQLGEDAWLISVPAIELTQPINNVVSLLTFEGNAKDRSNTGNDGSIHGSVGFFNTPISGFPQGSDKFVAFTGGVISQSNSSKYDLSGDFTIEAFIRTSKTFTGRGLFTKRDLGDKGVAVNLNTTTNTLSFVLDDGAIQITGSITPTFTINDNVPRHFALVIDRTSGDARLYVNGTESTAQISLGALGDVTNVGKIVVGGTGIVVGNYLGDMDNLRLALNAVYDITSATLVPPISGFIEFQEEALDEFQTDIRIVDEGDLNKTLILRLLNLMRPSSERLNVIFIRFFDDFLDGVGQFEVLQGSAIVNTEQRMLIAPDSFIRTDVLGDTDFKDIVLQNKIGNPDVLGGEFSCIFFVQDIENYYEFRINTATAIVTLFKVVASVEIQIGAPKSEDIVPGADYIFTIATSFNGVTNETLIQTFVDSNKKHEVLDTTFEKGKFGYKTDLNTTITVDEIEMLQLPVDVRRIDPGFNL